MILLYIFYFFLSFLSILSKLGIFLRNVLMDKKDKKKAGVGPFGQKESRSKPASITFGFAPRQP